MTSKPSKYQQKAGQPYGEKYQISKGPPWYRSQRYILAFILCGGIMNLFFQRNNMNIAIVCMVNHTYSHTSSNTNTTSNNVTVLPNKEKQQMNKSLDGNEKRRIRTWLGPGIHQNDSRASNNEIKKWAHRLNSTLENEKYHSLRPSVHAFISFETERTKANMSQHGYGRLRGNNNTHLNMNGKIRESEQMSLSHRTNNYAKDRNNTSLSRPENLDRCSAISDNSEESEEDGPLRWSKQTQGLVLGAMYWTYSAMSLPGQAIVRNLSRKRVIVMSMTVLTLMTMLIHVAALWSPWAVVAVKLVQGVCTAVCIMSMYGIWGKWAPPEERSGLVSLSFAGSIIANAIVFPVSGLLCKYGFLGGWPSVFYVFGFIGMLWVVVFVLFTADTPASHPSITAEERHYIESSLSSISSTTKPPKTPWKSVLTSLPVWAFVFQHLTYSWALFLIMTTGSLYMKEVLRFPVDSNGLYTMLPYVLQYIVANLSGQAINFILRRKLARLIWIRRVGSVIGNILPAISLLLLSFLDCTQSTLAVFLLTLTVGMTGINLNVFFMNPYDIAPLFSQDIMTFSNTIAVANGVIAPYVVAYITKDKSKSQWQTVFYMTSAIMIVGTVVYCILGRVDVQPWAMTTMKRDMSFTVNGTGTLKACDSDVVTVDDEKKEGDNRGTR